MVEFKHPTWAQRAELRKILENAGLTIRKLAETGELPIDYCDRVLTWCYELTDEEKNKLSYTKIAELCTNAFLEIEIKPEAQKKS